MTGGTDDQTDNDITFFFNIKWRIDFPDDWDEAVLVLKNMYEKAGVDFEANERKPNVYRAIVNGEVGCTISQDEARRTLADYIQRTKKR